MRRRLPWFLLILLAAACATTSRRATPTTIGPRSDYAPLTDVLTPFVVYEMADKELPAVSIALVDGQEIVWADGFGWADRAETVPAGADTLYRVGSVSKLFTAIAVMQHVERGELYLDAPLSAVLPELELRAPYPEPITLRQILAHRSGMVREPPVGSYFDPDEPGLAATVASLNRTDAIYPPGERLKYSNAAVSVAGYAVERVSGIPFEERVDTAVLDPIGMDSSGFQVEPAYAGRIAAASMWTRDGRTFDAPTFDLGIGPAGSLYASVTDLGDFLALLFAAGAGREDRVLEQETLTAMWMPYGGEEKGFGIGFVVGELDGHLTVGHDGAVYGFATSLIALPDQELGVVVTASLDVTNAVTNRVAEAVLRGALALRSGEPVPVPERTMPIPRLRAARMTGTWRSEDGWLTIENRGGELRLATSAGAFGLRLRARGDDVVVDDRLAYGPKVTLIGDQLVFGSQIYQRAASSPPEECPPRWRGLVGEYGWEHNTLNVLEDRGRLVALIEWFFYYPLEEVDEDRYRFPDHGLYHGEELVFERGPDGRAHAVTAASVRFERRELGAEDGATFRITPQHPTTELERMAAESRPPEEDGKRAPDLVDLRELDVEPSIRFDVRYATENNFLGTRLYPAPHAYLQRPAARALARAHARLTEQGYGLLIHDAFRPWRVTKMFWDATPVEMRAFVADPSQGSRHNRGCAVDLTLYALDTGEAVRMVSGYDEFSPRSSPTYPGGTSLQRWRRELLRTAMEAEGFAVYENEWWHFDFRDWREYPILERFPAEE